MGSAVGKRKESKNVAIAWDIQIPWTQGDNRDEVYWRNMRECCGDSGSYIALVENESAHEGRKSGDQRYPLN